MVELIGDPCAPSDFNLPILTTAEANIIIGTPLIQGAMICNKTLGKAEIWTGVA